MNNEPINVVFDELPRQFSRKFVKVETDDGESIGVGKWYPREDGSWALRITALPTRTARQPTSGAMRAADIIVDSSHGYSVEGIAVIIDRETVVPELLAACKKVVKECPCCEGDGELRTVGPGEVKCYPCVFCATVRAAVAKHEGEEQR